MKDEIRNGIDDNCDGVVDEGFACEVNAVQECYSGSPNTRDAGLCHVGKQDCANGVWGECIGDLLPAEEIKDGRDNDCDGIVDEDHECRPGQEQECYGGTESTLEVGSCKAGKQRCQGGVWGDCVGDVLPGVDECNGFDEDCDGAPDDTCPCVDGEIQDCHGNPEVAGIGECVKGTQECQDGKWGDCVGDVNPTHEICNLRDDDCNRNIDDGELGVDRPCVVPELRGPCSNGSTFCSPEGLQCKQTLFATAELCNGIDDDCDGIPDQGNPGGGATCLVTGDSQPLGECGVGRQTCEGGRIICRQVNIATVETCDLKDNDCNGQIDNGNLCCRDTVTNGAETDTDCGGSCGSTCAPGKRCIQDSDCQSSVCDTGGGIGTCRAPSCNDRRENGDESDVDCGGSCPIACAIGRTCAVPSDCGSGVCTSNVCISPGCADGVRNGGETYIDCGGSDCPNCDDGERCVLDGDCQSSRCVGTICQAPTCTDRASNGGETDVDCGGEGSCPRCTNGSRCLASRDCLSGVCIGQSCVEPTCADLVKNGNETDIDCGGPCPEKCAIGQRCEGNDDCDSNVCTGGFCAKKPIGSACMLSKECSMDQCVDGYCCNSECLGLCMACSNSIKGTGENGYCEPIAVGADPQSECGDDAASSCQRNGACDGGGQCQIYSASTPCSSPTCNEDNSSVINADRCNGRGVCIDLGTTDCFPSLCIDGACAHDCSRLGDAACATDAYCNGRICRPKQNNGENCSDASDCLSGNCEERVCCDLPCNGECESCIAAKKGPDGGPNGICGFIKAGSDPDLECPDRQPRTCLTTGSCSGFGHCEYYSGDTICNQPTCSEDRLSELHADTCDGSGVCEDGGGRSCGYFRCFGNACLDTCASDADCAPTAYCAGSTCEPKKPEGRGCVEPNECMTNHCVDDVCCDTQCGEDNSTDCQTCNDPGSPERAGTCGPRPPGAICRESSGLCDRAETCNGANMDCPDDEFADEGALCGMMAHCVDNTAYAADLCDVNGICQTGGLQVCGSYRCKDGICLLRCANDMDCVDTARCERGACLTRTVSSP
ncbi:hypothetical protein [Sorangium sp. So ce136]|uniref:hypothetical protein n=1 Tax=Sorangium sp. So ce136 TaxID=3133284 RepID=UPI003F51F1D0